MFMEYTKRHIFGASSEIQSTLRALLTEIDGLDTEPFEDVGDDLFDYVIELKPTDYCTNDLSDLKKALDSLRDIDNMLASTNKTCPLCLVSNN